MAVRQNRRLFSSLLAQKIINILYRYPRSRLKQYRRFGGYWKYRSMLQGHRQMKRASAALPAVLSVPEGLPVYFLTGKNFIHQTLYCIRSLITASSSKFHFILVDDGSFDDQLIARIQRQLPGAMIVTGAMIEKNLDSKLPRELFPALRKKRLQYPHLKKITDIHTIPGPPWKLVMDSDMLFWGEPDEIINWLHSPKMPVHLLDCEESYGYSRPLMESLSGYRIPELLNVGVIGLNSDTLPWSDLERWVPELERQEGTSYYLEQALSAMLVARGETAALPPEQYIVNPVVGTLFFTGKLCHYVDLSKRDYFQTEWKKIK
jgi:hypothetical protein